MCGSDKAQLTPTAGEVKGVSKMTSTHVQVVAFGTWFVLPFTKTTMKSISLHYFISEVYIRLYTKNWAQNTHSGLPPTAL